MVTVQTIQPVGQHRLGPEDVLVGRIGGKAGIQQCIVFGHPIGPSAMGQDPHVRRGQGAGLITTQHRHGSLGDHRVA